MSLAIGRDGHVAVIEIDRPPLNFFDRALVVELADAFEAVDADPALRAIVLCAAGSVFCAGADFGRDNPIAGAPAPGALNPIYEQALRLFSCRKPVVAAVHGAAVGGGLGLALMADFRVTCPEARFSANFSRLGIHPGFGMSVTMPRILGVQRAALLAYTGRRVPGDEAVSMGLADLLVARDAVRPRALELAAEIAASAPIAVESIRQTFRLGLVDAIRAAVLRETTEQAIHSGTDDFREGVAAMAARRAPVFRRR
jgi:enoyl-CoA hydratase/carnithine racemase